MPRKAIKRLVINFYDDEQGETCVEWLDKQDNMGDAIRELIVQAVSGNASNSTGGDNSEPLDRIADALEKIVIKATHPIPQPTYKMADEPKVMQAPSEMRQTASTFGTKAPVIMEPPTDAAGDGSSANNLLHSLDSF